MMRSHSMVCGILLFGSLTACVPGVGEPGAGPPSANSSLHIVYADASRGVAATWDDGVEQLDLRALIDAQGFVRSTITDHGRIVTRMVVPLGNATDLANQIGPAALEVSQDPALLPADQAAQDRLRQLLPVYGRALDQLFAETDALGGSSLRMALPWNEEVLARLVVSSTPGMDAEAACPEHNSALHTKFMHSPELIGLLGPTAELAAKGAGVAYPRCNLGCAWYDVCCLHDQACVYCNHWWCGWSCVPGCFGGECGGGG